MEPLPCEQHVPNYVAALEASTKPLGIAEYRLVESLPEPLQTALPTIEQIERELGASD